MKTHLVRQCAGSMVDIDWSFVPVPFANILGFLLILSSFSLSLLTSSNIGVVTFGLGTAFMSLATGIESIVWYGNTNDIAPVWCDIGKYVVAPGFNLPLDEAQSATFSLANKSRCRLVRLLLLEGFTGLCAGRNGL